MNLRSFEYVLAVHEHGHFGRAATALSVSQPTLSGQILKLEELLGVALFERTSRGVHTTAAGRQIVAEARSMLKHSNTIRELARVHSSKLSGPFRLGIIPTIAPYIAPLILGPLHESFPEVEFSLGEGITPNLLAMLKNYHIDAAIMATNPADADIDERLLYDEPFLLACPTEPSHKASKSSLVMADIEPESLLLLSEDHCLSDQIISFCSLPPNSIARANLRAANLQTLVELVRAGYGSTFLPQISAHQLEKYCTGMALLKIEPEPTRTVRLMFRKNSPMTPFIDQMGSVISRAVAPALAHDDLQTAD